VIREKTLKRDQLWEHVIGSRARKWSYEDGVSLAPENGGGRDKACKESRGD